MIQSVKMQSIDYLQYEEEIKMTAEEVMEYFKNTENRKAYIDTIQLPQDEEKAKKKREDLEKDLSDEEYIKKIINKNSPRKFSFSVEIKTVHPEILSSMLYFIGKDGKIEQFQFFGNNIK